MTTTPTQQTDALRLADEYRPTMPHYVLHLWAKDTAAELRRQHAEIARLTDENEALKAHKTGKTLSTDYIALKASQAGIEAVTHEITLFAELLTRAERAARIEAQQRLADAQELAAKSGLAHRLSVQRCVQAAVAEAVAAEREACALVCDEFFVPEQVLGAHPDYLEGKHMAKSQCSAAIRARGTP